MLQHTVTQRSFSNQEHLKPTMYLEKRPLKKAFTSNCGLGIMPAFRKRQSNRLYLPMARRDMKQHIDMQCRWLCDFCAIRPPELDFLRSADDGGDAAGVHLQQGHLSRGVRGEEGRSSSLSPTHVPAGQTQLDALRVPGEQTLTKCQANATAQKHTGHLQVSLQHPCQGNSVSGKQNICRPFKNGQVK